MKIFKKKTEHNTRILRRDWEFFFSQSLLPLFKVRRTWYIKIFEK